MLWHMLPPLHTSPSTAILLIQIASTFSDGNLMDAKKTTPPLLLSDHCFTTFIHPCHVLQSPISSNSHMQLNDADGAFRDMLIMPSSAKRVATMVFPLVVYVVVFTCLFPITLCGPWCGPSDRILFNNNGLQQQPSIHPSWCDCFYIRTDIVVISTFPSLPA